MRTRNKPLRKRLSLISGLVLALSFPAAATSSFAAENTAKQPEGVSTLLSGLLRIGDYLGGVAHEATAVSKREITVGNQYRCLAQAVYFEARGESLDGQRAVAHVVLNRVQDRRYPNTVCGVVFQNRHLANRCQFSFACDGVSDEPRQDRAWRRALVVAMEALTGVSGDITHASTHYHARYVEPLWAPSLKETVRLGQHIFYRDGDPRAAVLAADTPGL